MEGYYIYIEDNKIDGCGIGARACGAGNVIDYPVSEEVFKFFKEDKDRYIWDGQDIIPNPDYEEIKRQKLRQELDALTLTPADVERALYKAKGMDFEDLKALIAEKIPTIDVKGLAIEFRAKDFFRGATVTLPLPTGEVEAAGEETSLANSGEGSNQIRLIDVVGQLLGYTADDMDYLFQNKELPENEN